MILIYTFMNILTDILFNRGNGEDTKLMKLITSTENQHWHYNVCGELK